MLRKFVLPALGLMILPAFASAQFEAGNWELTLSGGGNVNKAVTSDGISGTFEVGYFATKELEIGVRQSLAHTSTQNGSRQVTLVNTQNNGDTLTPETGVVTTRSEGWFGNTSGLVDYHFDLGRFQPFVGVSGGYVYTNVDRHVTNVFTGETLKINDSSWVGGPEVGLKYFVNGTTFVFVRTAYTFWFADHSNDQFAIDLGVGFRF